jgi:hypothetical protein
VRQTKASDPDGNTVKYVFQFMTDGSTVVGHLYVVGVCLRYDGGLSPVD